jgi:hypothetical protein
MEFVYSLQSGKLKMRCLKIDDFQEKAGEAYEHTHVPVGWSRRRRQFQKSAPGRRYRTNIREKED